MIKPKKVPYSGTQVAAERTYSQIQQFLLDSGCEAVQVTRSAQGDVTIRFGIEVEVGGVRRKIGIEIRPALLAQRKRQQGRFGSLVTSTNESASARLAYWYIKSKIEAVAFGLVSAEREFFSQIMVALPDGGPGTVGDMAEQSILDGGGVMLPGIDIGTRPRQLPPGGREGALVVDP
jgi:hypothetical protein